MTDSPKPQKPIQVPTPEPQKPIQTKPVPATRPSDSSSRMTQRPFAGLDRLISGTSNPERDAKRAEAHAEIARIKVNS